MISDAPANGDADTAQFVISNPYPPVSGIAPRCHAKLRRRAYHDLFKSPHEIGHAQSCGMEVHDWVPDKLARSMEGDVSAAFDVKNRNAGFFQKTFGYREVVEPAPPAQSENRRVLQKKQDIGIYGCRFSGFYNPGLQLPGLRVVQ